MTNLKVKLTTLTPLHIGSGSLLAYNSEYLFFRKQNVCAIIDQEKVLQLIGPGNIDQWVNCIANGDDLLQYLQQRKPALQPADVANRLLQARLPANVKSGLREQMRTGSGWPLLPGSSIKGAVRTAFFASEVFEKYPNGAGKEDVTSRDRKNRAKWSDKTIQKKVMGRDPNHDRFRLVQISDLHFPVETVALPVGLLNYGFRGWEARRSPLFFAEAIPEKISATFTIRLTKPDRRQKIQPAWRSPAELFASVNEHTRELLDYDRSFFEDDTGEAALEYVQQLDRLLALSSQFNPETTCLLRMGFGSGWLFMTGAWQLAEGMMKMDALAELRQFVQKRFYPENVPLPKTRKVFGHFQPPGFVKLELLN